jgi:hypothetical protein
MIAINLSGAKLKDRGMSLNENNEKHITALGVVIPVDWDEQGNPRSFALSTYKEQEYLIDGLTEPGRRLMNLVHRKIRVTGELGAVINNRRLITVKHFEPV